MGNHDAGRAMGLAATAALHAKTEWTKDAALELLDIICQPWKDCDAEFESEDPKRPGHIHPKYESYTDPEGPLGKLILVAFGKKGEDYDEEAWWDGPYTAFKKRYKFW